MVSRGKDPATPDLGVTAGLGLPLDSAKRGRVYRLPPSKRELGSTVHVPGLDLPKDIAITAAVTQSGRVRVSNLLAHPLDWESGMSLHSSKEWLRFARGVRVPALALRAATPSDESRSAVSPDGRITIRVDERLHLGLDLHGDAVLAVVRRATPTVLWLLGERSLSAILEEWWPRAR